MTSVIGWAAYDSRRLSAIYLATDSRVTWSPAPNVWDCTQKTFCLRNSPEAFAYCGDTLGMTQLISQITVAIEQGFIPPPSSNNDRRDDI